MLPLLLALTAPAAAAAPADVIRVGGPSAPGDTKIAIVAGGHSFVGQTFTVTDQSGTTVTSGTLEPAPGGVGPWPFAARADLSSVHTPGRYLVHVGALQADRAWVVRAAGSGPEIRLMLRFFAANRDGRERSPIHGPAHLHDARVASGPYAGRHIDLTGGYMDAGDQVHLTLTTAYATTLLLQAARYDSADAPALKRAASVGVRWLLKAHPAPDLFIGQVGDGRDHDYGFRRPEDDDRSTLPGIGTRLAYPVATSEVAGQTAAALALQARINPGRQRLRLLRAAKEWYAMGKARHTLRPRMPGGFYTSGSWRDDMLLAATELYLATHERAYLSDARAELHRFVPDGDGALTWDSVGALAAVELCGSRSTHRVIRDRACARIFTATYDGSRQAGDGFGRAGWMSWGTTARSAGAAAIIALTRSRAAAEGARDWMFGRNQWGASFVVGSGPNAPRKVHSWASLGGDGLPLGAVVDGPATFATVTEQLTARLGPLDTPDAFYEDRREDYVTSEPALDFTASSVLLLAVLQHTQH